MALSADDLQRLSGWLDELLELPAGDARQARLQAIGASDPALRDRLAALLAQADDGTTEGLDALPELVRSIGEAQATASGQRIGPYELLRCLGEGGMGSVWLARRVEGEPRREVALKLPRLAGAPGAFAWRFERERDILAQLEHPLIARLYEAGTAALPDGGEQPWLAMEPVDGQPLGSYCDAARMDLRSRVLLFLQVLQAVQFAHGRLVVHRDLKPGNILVTADGQVRLLDFGVAKLLEGPAGGHPVTEMAAAPMTPMYASPEQVAGRPVGIASDIYSLGVVLYELLTGCRPYRLSRDTRGALEQAILDADLTRPSRTSPDAQAAQRRATQPAQLRRQLRGDLDTILLQALRQAPEQRYATAQAMEDDLRRWLAHQPVRAHPDSWHYRLRKFGRRHALPLGAATLASLGLVAGLLMALDQARRAEREARRTLAVQNFLIGLVREVGPGRAQGRPLTVGDLLDRGEQRLDGDLGTEPGLRGAISDALLEIRLEVGDGKRSLPMAEKRLALALAQDGDGSLPHGDALLVLGRAQVLHGRFEPALVTLARARQIFQAHPGQRDDALLSLDNRVAGALNSLLRHGEAIALLRSLIPRLQARWPQTHWEEVQARSMLATALAADGQRDEALRIVAALEPVLARGWPEQGFGLAAMQANLGYVLWRQRAFEPAAVALQGAITEMDRLLGPVNSPAVDAGRTLGMVHLDAGRYARASEVLEANLARSRAMHGADDAELALNLSFTVLTRLRLMRLDDAEAAARDSVRIAQAHPGLSASELRGLRRRLGQVLVQRGQAAEALAVLDAVAAEERQAQQLKDVRHASTLLWRAGALAQLGRHREAADTARAAATIQADQPASPAARIALAKARLTEVLCLLPSPLAADRAATTALLSAAEAALAAEWPAGHPDRALAGAVRAHWLRAQGQDRAAAAALSRSQADYLAASGAPMPDRLLVVF
ncbi:serine/threonine-protein kinase [Ideonella alba]|uniref:Serine/threonine protein kinase n=1 Tax=Ideonella alba TaxID=2824118 RepID=A0A940YFB1_9BURK|nr:serine/threonine-protein kinase [Ideonella alba]MBQ0931430.1 serine/threonine protein kinase [Ideonella alba]